MIPLLGARLHTIRTPGVGSTVAGDYVPGPAVMSSVRGSLQPATPEQIAEFDAGGVRVGAAWMLWVDHDAQIQIADPSAQLAGARLEHKGRDLEARGVKDWTEHADGLPHYVYMFVLVEANE